MYLGGSMLNTFRVISMVEGLSFLLLLFVAMPLKYQYGFPQAVTAVGWAHGLLFIAYVLWAQTCGQRYNWPEMFKLRVLISGMIPFACFFLDKKLKSESAELVMKST